MKFKAGYIDFDRYILSKYGLMVKYDRKIISYKMIY